MSAFFFQRINDHIQYLRRLEQTLKDQGDFRGYDFHSCKLGQWIDTEGLSQIPEGADKAKLVFAEMEHGARAFPPDWRKGPGSEGSQ